VVVENADQPAGAGLPDTRRPVVARSYKSPTIY